MGFGNDFRDAEFVRQIDLARFVEWEKDRTAAFFQRLYQHITDRLKEFDEAGGDLYRAAHLRELQKSFRATLGEGFRDYRAFMEDDLFQMAVSEGQFVKNTVDTLAGLPLTSNVLTPAWLKAIVHGQVVQGAPMYEWWQRQANGTQQKIMDAVRLGMAEGDGIAEIATRLQGSATSVGKMVLDPITNNVRWLPAMNGGVQAFSRRNAEAITRTAAMGIAADARRDMYSSNRDVIKGIQQVSALDGRTTETCIMYDGESWDFEDDSEPYDPDSRKPATTKVDK